MNTGKQTGPSCFKECLKDISDIIGLLYLQTGQKTAKYDESASIYIAKASKEAELQAKRHFFEPIYRISVIRSLPTCKLVCDTKRIHKKQQWGNIRVCQQDGWKRTHKSYACVGKVFFYQRFSEHRWRMIPQTLATVPRSNYMLPANVCNILRHYKSWCCHFTAHAP